MSYIQNGAVTREFAALMVWLAEATTTTLTEGRIRSYAQEFANVSLDDLKRACANARRECEFFPTIPQIRRQLQPTTDDAALIAWAALNRAVSAAGSYMSVELDDVCAAAALVDVFGGWPQFCDVPDGPALALKRQEFLAAYRHARRQNRSDVKPTRLAGICEASGNYPRGSLTKHVWVAQVSTLGDVQTRRERRELPPAQAHESLPDSNRW